MHGFHMPKSRRHAFNRKCHRRQISAGVVSKGIRRFPLPSLPVLWKRIELSGGVCAQVPVWTKVTLVDMRMRACKIRTDTYVHTHTHINTYIQHHTNIHTCIHAHMSCIHPCIHVYMRTYIQTDRQADTQNDIYNTYIHPCIHTYTFTHTHIRNTNTSIQTDGPTKTGKQAYKHRNAYARTYVKSHMLNYST